MQTKVFDVAVFGGGVIGACIFNNIVKSGYSCVLLEKGLDLSTGASKANSAIVHAGFDAKPGTLKARFNVEGNGMFPEMCERLNVPLKKIGAYVIGDNVEVVKDLMKRGVKNNVKNLVFLGHNDLKKRLPNVADNVSCGLFAPDSYIVNPYLLTICLAEEGVVNDGEVKLNWDTEKIYKEKNYFIISNGKNIVKAKKIVNACGSGYNDLAKILKSEKYDITFKRGEYYVLDHSEKDIVESTIFPLPDAHTKGILITPTVDGNILIGPTSYESDSTTVTTQDGLNSIHEKCKTLVKNINLSKAIKNFAGVRSVVGDDFVIELSKKVEGVVNIAGICSPGLSSAPAIAKYVMSLLNLKYDLNVKIRKIIPYTNLRDLSDKEKNVYIKKNPKYGKIVCKCENISEGEIVDAINRPIRPTTTDGIKRRVRPGMGRCQGSFCLDKVIEILARENHDSFNNIKKEGLNSQWVVGDVTGGWTDED